MFHQVARAVAGTVLFHDWVEARMLWLVLIQALGRPRGLLLMPDHLHAMLEKVTPAFGRALNAYARARNARRNESGPVWDPSPEPEALPNADHAREGPSGTST